MLSTTVILNLFQNLVEILRLSWIIRGAGGVTSDQHLTGSALLHPTENPQTQHNKMGRSLPSLEFLNSLRSLRNSPLSHTAYSLTRLILRRFELASHKGRGEIFYVTNLSTIPPFNSSTLFTLHPSLSRPPPHPNPQPYGIQSHSAHSSPVRTSIPQGARENLFYETNLSTLQLFTLSTLLTPHS